MVHHWFGWISVAIGALLLAKYIGRVSGNRELNGFLRKVHRPAGLILLGIALAHGGISFLKANQRIASNVTGLLLFLLLLLLAGSYYARKKLKGKWFSLHRYLAIAFGLGAVLHVIISIA